MEQKQLAQRLNHVKKYITISYLAQPVYLIKILKILILSNPKRESEVKRFTLIVILLSTTYVYANPTSGSCYLPNTV